MSKILLTICLVLLTSCAPEKPSDLLVFDVHFAVLTQNPKAHEKATSEQLKKEVDILNKYFVTEERKKIVEFNFKSAHFYSDIKNSSCEFTQLGDFTGTYDKSLVKKNYFACKDTNVRDPEAINIYITDSYSPKHGFAYTTSRGGFNHGKQPFILLDWERLNHTKQSPEEHEMGHAFGLGHVCEPDAKRQSHTNIMASTSNCPGSGGLRDIGFNEEQTKKILSNAAIIKRNFEKEGRNK